MPRAETNPDWYRLMYSLAATYANRSARRAASETPSGDRSATSRSAWADAYRAAAVADRALAAGAALGQGAPERVATLFDRTFAPTLLVLWAGARATTNRLKEFAPDTVPELPPNALPGGSSRAAEPQAPLRPPEEGVVRALERLYPSAEPTTEPKAVVDLVSKDRHLHYRVAYNVACYRTQALGEAPFPISTGQLLMQAIQSAPGAQSARMAAQALSDPSLEPLLGPNDQLRRSVSALAQRGTGDGPRRPSPPPASSAR